MKSNLNITYERDATSSYLVIKIDDSLHIENYEVEMIGRNTIDPFLDFNVRRLNTEKNLYYNITSKQKLTDLLERKRLSFDEIKNFFSGLITMMKDCDRYYLSSHKIVLDPSMIYVSPDGFVPHFIYTPFSNISIDILDEMKGLIEYLFDKVDQDDVKAVMLMHKLVTASKQPEYNLGFIEEIIHNSVDNNTIQENTIKEIVDDHTVRKEKNDDDSIISRLIEKNKQKEQAVVAKNEIVEKIKKSSSKMHEQAPKKSFMANNSNKSEKTKDKRQKISNYLHYISIGCIQVITILIFLIMLKSNVLHSDVTGKIKIESFFAAMAMLFALNLYGSKKLFDHLMRDKKEEHINMNKQQVYNQPPIDTFSTNARNRNKLFVDGSSKEDSKKENVINKKAGAIDNKPEWVDEGSIKEPIRKEVSYRSHSDDKDYSSDDTQLLESYNEELNIELSPYLLSKEGDMINKVLLSNTPFIIGKLEGQVDYIIENSSVSRIHCKIVKEDNSYFIIDLNSKNGTYLDEERIVSNEKYRLCDGSHIAISNCEFSFEVG